MDHLCNGPNSFWAVLYQLLLFPWKLQTHQRPPFRNLAFFCVYWICLGDIAFFAQHKVNSQFPRSHETQFLFIVHTKNIPFSLWYCTKSHENSNSLTTKLFVPILVVKCPIFSRYMPFILRQNKSENYGRVFYHCQGQLAAMLCLIGFVPNQILVCIQSCLTPALQLRPNIVHLLRIILMELYWWLS